MKAIAGLFLLLATPVGAHAAPVRVASLNLCSDELALLLAAPGQLVSVSRLGADRRETLLAARAQGLAVNRGRVTDVVALAPDLILTSGGDPNAAATARRLGIATLELPQPHTLGEVAANVRSVARALGRAPAGEALVAAMAADLGVPPRTTHRALFVGGGGVTIAADGLGAAWLRHAGLIEAPGPRGRVNLERILASPPQVLLVSNYHAGERSNNQAWLNHPALAALPAGLRRLGTDGRAWTCLGPPVAAEIARLRKAIGG